MDPYELFDKDFDEFVRLGLVELYGDHPGAYSELREIEQEAC